MKVFIPSPLHSYTGSKGSVEAKGKTVDQVTHDLDRQFPGIRFRIIDEQNRIRPHIKIFVNKDQTFDLASALEPSDELTFVQAFSGG